MARIKFVTTVVIFSLLFPSLSFAFDQKKVLRGLKGVEVLCYIPPEIERLGLKKSTIQTNVETKLKRVGIKVYKKAKLPAMSTLFVNINAVNLKPKSIVIYHIGISLIEWVFLKREIGTIGDLMEVRATNWYTGNLGSVGISSLKSIEKQVDEMVNKFSYDYLSVNSN